MAIGVGHELHGTPAAGLLQQLEALAFRQEARSERVAANLVAREVLDARLLADPLYGLIDAETAGVAEYRRGWVEQPLIDDPLPQGVHQQGCQRDAPALAALGHAQQGKASSDVDVAHGQPAGLRDAGAGQGHKQNGQGDAWEAVLEEGPQPLVVGIVDRLALDLGGVKYNQ